MCLCVVMFMFIYIYIHICILVCLFLTINKFKFKVWREVLHQLLFFMNQDWLVWESNLNSGESLTALAFSHRFLFLVSK